MRMVVVLFKLRYACEKKKGKRVGGKMAFDPGKP
jgi:hypothetical protein